MEAVQINHKWLLILFIQIPKAVSRLVSNITAFMNTFVHAAEPCRVRCGSEIEVIEVRVPNVFGPV